MKSLFRLRGLVFEALLEHSVLWHAPVDHSAARSVSLMIGDTASLANLGGTTVGIVFSVVIGLFVG